MTLRKQLVDQSAHTCAAVALVLPLLLWPSLWTALLAGFGGGLIREITEGPPVFGPGSRLDLLFWTIGGGAAWAVANF